MPEPTHFINPALGPVAIIRPSSTQNSGSVAAILSFKQDGLFIGQDDDFVEFLLELAQQVDAAQRGYLLRSYSMGHYFVG